MAPLFKMAWQWVLEGSSRIIELTLRTYAMLRLATNTTLPYNNCLLGFSETNVNDVLVQSDIAPFHLCFCESVCKFLMHESLTRLSGGISPSTESPACMCG